MKYEKLTTSSSIALLGVIVLIVLFSVQWCTVHSTLKDYKTEKVKELSSIKKMKENSIIELKAIKKKDSLVQIKIKDIELINNRYQDLVEYVDNNTNRAESLIDKDLDRLNLYMSIGIGFLGVLGVFVPVLVNFMSVQDLRDKLFNENKKADDISKSVAKLNNKVDGVATYYSKSGPAIKSLILQNAISRFFNVSPRLITRLMRGSERQHFTGLLKTISDGFKECMNDGDHSLRSNEFLKGTIMDFRRIISDQTFQTTLFDQNVTESFDELSLRLKELLNSESQDEENDKISQVCVIIDNIIRELNHL